MRMHVDYVLSYNYSKNDKYTGKKKLKNYFHRFSKTVYHFLNIKWNNHLVKTKFNIYISET